MFAVGLAAAAFLLSLAVLQREPGASLAEPLLLLLVLRVAFALLAWALTRKPREAPTPLAEPSRLPAMLLYLAVFSLLVLGWGFSAILQAVPTESMQSVVQVLVKMLAMVVLPLWLFKRGASVPVDPMAAGGGCWCSR